MAQPSDILRAVNGAASLHGNTGYLLAEGSDPTSPSVICRGGLCSGGYPRPNNRDGESFEGLHCGDENHADHNAAKNVALRYLRRNQTGFRWRRARWRAIEQGDTEDERSVGASCRGIGQNGSPR